MDGTVADCLVVSGASFFFVIPRASFYHGSSWSVEQMIDLGCRRCGGQRPAIWRMCCFGHREALWLRRNAQAGGGGAEGVVRSG